LVLGGYVLWPSLRTLGESFCRDGRLTLANYADFFDLAHPANLEALWHSLLLSFGSVLLCALIGVPLAFIFTRFEFPGRRLFAALALLPMTLPPLVGVLSFYFLYGESGLIPRGLQALLHLDQVPFAIDGIAAVYVVHAYTMYVYFYLFVSAALRGLDPAVVEAAYNLGASPFTVLRRVLLPLLTPALVGAALLVFMTSMASFSAPYLFASGYRVLSVQVFHSKVNHQWDLAVTQTVILSLFSLLFLLGLRRYSGQRRYAMMSKGVTAPLVPIRRGGLRWGLGGLGIGTVLVLLLPHLTIVLMSFVKDGTWTWQVLPPEYTWENYRRLFREPQVFRPIRRSLQMAGMATLGNLFFGVAAAYLLAKRRGWGRGMLDVLVMLPWALPGTVVAMNLIVAFNRPTWLTAGQVLTGSFWILPLAYFVRHLPLVVRSTHAALEQIDDSLEEAARSLGASWFYAFRRVLLPLVLPGVLAGTLLAFVTALGEFVSSILLYTVHNRPISIAILAQLRDFHFGSAAAYSVFLILLIGAVLWFSRSVLKSGETAF